MISNANGESHDSIHHYLLRVDKLTSIRDTSLINLSPKLLCVIELNNFHDQAKPTKSK
jgi:hypothetical protein